MPAKVSQKRIDAFLVEASRRLKVNSAKILDELSFYLDDEFTFLRREELGRASATVLARSLGIPLKEAKKGSSDEGVSDLIFVAAFNELAEINRQNEPLLKVNYILGQYRGEPVVTLLDSLLI